MKLIHASDLHIGKQLYGISLAEDQRYILHQIVEAARSEKADAIVIAGDVFDTSRPPEDAVSIFNDFMNEASEGFEMFIIPGNHDSSERLGIYRSLMRKGIHICGPFHSTGKAERCVFTDSLGEVNIWLLPYIRTSTVRLYYGDPSIDTSEKAFRRVFSESGVDPAARNVLVCHQFIVGGDTPLQTSDSEEVRLDTLGGAECVPYRVLDPFDYVAAGHIHRPQRMGRDTVRYCGSPLKYSESEADDVKGVDSVEIGAKGEVSVRHIPLRPLHDVRCVSGTVDEILAHRDEVAGCFVYANVVMSSSIGNIQERLRAAIPLLMHVHYDSPRAAVSAENAMKAREMESKPPADLFAEFFEKVTGRKLTPEQRKVLLAAAERAEAGE